MQTISIGSSVRFSKTVSESDIYLFAGITGDFSPNHVDREFMKGTAYGRRIAHGALLVGYMSNASSLLLEHYTPEGEQGTPVSLGYDRIRFLRPVFIGDTITVQYRVASFDRERGRSVSDIEVVNQHGAVVAVAQHIMKWVPADS